jgi:hypothetical protein
MAFSRTEVDCDLELFGVIQGDSICQPDPDTGDWICETSEPQPDVPIELTLRVHNAEGDRT